MSPNRKIYGIAGALATLAIPFIIMMTDSHVESSQSLCPFKMLTGFPCPGCGITKSMIFLYKGELLKSLSYHIFGPALFLFCVSAAIIWSVELITNTDYLNPLLSGKKLTYMVATLIGSYHFMRLVVFVSTTSFSDILKESVWR